MVARIFRRVLDTLDWVYDKIPVRFTCVHNWKITSIQEESEACRFLVRLECLKCGASAEHRRP